MIDLEKIDVEKEINEIKASSEPTFTLFSMDFNHISVHKSIISSLFILTIIDIFRTKNVSSLNTDLIFMIIIFIYSYFQIFCKKLDTKLDKTLDLMLKIQESNNKK